MTMKSGMMPHQLGAWLTPWPHDLTTQPHSNWPAQLHCGGATTVEVRRVDSCV